jgi:hypothetical protein
MDKLLTQSTAPLDSGPKFAPDGSLYVTDDNGGRIWQIALR